MEHEGNGGTAVFVFEVVVPSRVEADHVFGIRLELDRQNAGPLVVKVMNVPGRFGEILLRFAPRPALVHHLLAEGDADFRQRRIDIGVPAGRYGFHDNRDGVIEDFREPALHDFDRLMKADQRFVILRLSSVEADGRHDKGGQQNRGQIWAPMIRMFLGSRQDWPILCFAEEKGAKRRPNMRKFYSDSKKH